MDGLQRGRGWEAENGGSAALRGGTSGAEAERDAVTLPEGEMLSGFGGEAREIMRPSPT